MDRLTGRVLRFALVLFLSGMVSIASAAERQSTSSLRIIDVPGSFGTQSNAINDRGMIVGGAQLPGGPIRTGYLLADKFFTKVEHPDTAPGYPTIPWGISNRGEIVGLFFDTNFNIKAFLLSEGQFTILDIPNALRSQAHEINNLGKIVGYFDDFSSVRHGFLLDGGVVTVIDVPNAIGTEVYGINDQGQIVGTFTDQSQVSRGFLLAGGVYTTINFPSSESTLVTAINNRGQIVGSYRINFVDYSFVFYRGKYTAIDLGIPNSNGGGRIDGINDQGQMIGSYYDFALNKFRGFLVNIHDYVN
jgi:probable HAF family extracellular repeat protein